jgi:hypothetical protein
MGRLERGKGKGGWMGRKKGKKKRRATGKMERERGVGKGRF